MFCVIVVLLRMVNVHRRSTIRRLLARRCCFECSPVDNRDAIDTAGVQATTVDTGRVPIGDIRSTHSDIGEGDVAVVVLDPTASASGLVCLDHRVINRDRAAHCHHTAAIAVVGRREVVDNGRTVNVQHAANVEDTAATLVVGNVGCPNRAMFAWMDCPT